MHEGCSLSNIRRSINRKWRSGLRTSVTFLHTSVTFLHTSATIFHTSVTILHTSATILHTSATILHTSVAFLHTSVAFLHTSVTFLHTSVTFLQSTFLRIAHTVLVVCGKIERHSDCRKETMHGGRSEFTPIPPPPANRLFFDDREQTSKSHVEPSRECRWNVPEPGCIAPLRSQ